MTQCPNCGHRLKITDISPNCPHCGVNVQFYHFEESFLREAKTAELSQAGFQVFLRRLKAVFIGSRLAVARWIVMLLPILTFLIPAARFTAQLPFRTAVMSLDAFGLYDIVIGGDLGFILQMLGSRIVGAEFLTVLVCIGVYILPFLLSTLILVVTLLCFVDIEKMQRVIIRWCCAGMLCSALAVIAITALGSGMAGNLVAYRGGIGLYVNIIAYIPLVVVNVLIDKKGIDIVYDEGMLERQAIWKKVKAGEVDIDDLPQPVVETAETREIEAEIRKQERELLGEEEAEEATE